MSATLFSFPINKKSNMVMYYIPNFGDWRNSIKRFISQIKFSYKFWVFNFRFSNSHSSLLPVEEIVLYKRWPRQEAVPLQPHFCCCVCYLFARMLMLLTTLLEMLVVGDLMSRIGLMERALRLVMSLVSIYKRVLLLGKVVYTNTMLIVIDKFQFTHIT